MHPDRQRLADFQAAQAMLARPGRVHLHHSPSSLCRFDGEFSQEGTPCRIVHLLGEHALGHAADVQLFDGNELVAVNDLTRELVHEISPLIGDMLVNALQLPHGLAAADRPLYAARHLALCPPQTLLSAPVPARVGYQVPREEELAQDVLEIITVCSARLYGARSHKHKRVIETLRDTVA